MNTEKEQEYSRGSEWRKWDLQVQTILDDGYISIDKYWNELKKEFPEKCKELISVIGTEDLIKKYDSKEYFFTDTVDNEKIRAINYAKLFLSYLDIFISNSGAVCITDHNYEHNYLLDSLYKESEKTKTKIIPGVEVNIQGVHMLVLFGDMPYGKSSYSEGIKTFLAKLNINNHKSDGVLTVSNKSYADVVDEIKKIGAICIYPHCNSDNGLFQERGKTDRTHLSDQFNCLNLNILQSKNKDSANKTAEYISSKSNLKSEFVFTLGSDARSLKDVLGSDEGENHCWIKADPTFDGLRQIIYERMDRVFIGDEPPVLGRVDANKTKYIDSLKIDQKNTYNGKQGIWFKDVNIKFNNELVAIIGNKGSGKSALSDIIGVLGHTHNAGIRHADLTFLNNDKEKRFRKKGFAENFEAELIWRDGSGEGVKVSLDKDIDLNEAEKLKYLPQNFFESITNKLDNSGFDKTLKSVIFLHISRADRLGFSTFEELEKEKRKNIESDLAILKKELHDISGKIIDLEKKGHPDYKESLNSLIEEKQNELNEHEKNKPPEIKDPSKKKFLTKDTKKEKQLEQLKKINEKRDDVADNINAKKEELELATIEKEDLNQMHVEIARFEMQISNYIKQNTDRFAKRKLDLDKIIELKFNYSALKSKIRKNDELIIELNKLLIPKYLIDNNASLDQISKEDAYKNSLLVQQQNLQNEIDKIKNELSKPERDFQEYRERLKIWEDQKKIIEGSKKIPGTYKFYIEEREFINKKLGAKLDKIKKDRNLKAVEIFSKKKEIIDLYRIFKESIDSQISADKEFVKKFKMEICAEFKLAADFPEMFLGYINKTKSGTFRGAQERQIKEIFAEKNLLEKDDVLEILNTIIEYLRQDQHPEIKEDNRKREISDQIYKIQDFYDFIFSLEYLRPVYELKLDGKNLNELSPGEKGALLLVFYLMIDKEEIPLIIDQPEDNLDNKSVFQVLTHFIKIAKKRRQIFIVTHNPNLAVGADAEQIVYVELDKKNNRYEFKYELGSIENSNINKRIVEVLEGTMPAFDKRKLKYLQNN